MKTFDIILLNKDIESRKKAMAAITSNNGSMGGYNHLKDSMTELVNSGLVDAIRMGEIAENENNSLSFIKSSLSAGNTVLLLFTTAYPFENNIGNGSDVLQLRQNSVSIPWVEGEGIGYKVDYSSVEFDTVKHVNYVSFIADTVTKLSTLPNVKLPAISILRVAVFAINSRGILSFPLPDGVKGIDFIEEYENELEAYDHIAAKTITNVVDSTLESGDTEQASQINTQTEKQETQVMSNVKTNAVNTIAKNKSAAVTVAKIEAGRIAVKQVSKVVTPKLPMMVRGYADTAVGRLVIANLFNFAVTQFAANNKNALLVADAMLEGAMLETLQSFNIEELINDVINKVDVSKLVDASDSE